MRLGRNLLAGLANSAVTALVGLAATPFYLHLLGIERYGVVGLLITAQALLSLLDVGLSPTLNREVARASEAGDLAPARGLLACLGWLYAGVAVIVILAMAAAAPWLAQSWLQRQDLSPAELTQALALLGLAVACRWPAGLYVGALNGAQRLVISSSLTSVYALVSAAGAIAVLVVVDASLPVFFLWQAVAAAFYTLAMRRAAWQVLGGRAGAVPAWGELARVWRFSASLGVIAVTSVVFTQMDKVLLSRLLSLEAFGRYSLATLVAGGLYVLVTPVFNAVYPRFSALVAAGKAEELWTLYRLGTRMIAALVFPVAMVLAVLAEPLLTLWTQEPDIAAAAAPVVSLLCAGTALHAVMYFPYALQLSHGMPRLSITINLVMIVVLVPLIITLTLAYAEVGAAAAWLCLHLLYVVLGTWVTHRHLFVGRGAAWLARDVGLPLLLTLAVGALALATGAGSEQGPWTLLGGAVLIWMAAAGVCLAASPGLLAALSPHVHWLLRLGKGA